MQGIRAAPHHHCTKAERCCSWVWIPPTITEVTSVGSICLRNSCSPSLPHTLPRTLHRARRQSRPTRHCTKAERCCRRMQCCWRAWRRRGARGRRPWLAKSGAEPLTRGLAFDRRKAPISVNLQHTQHRYNTYNGLECQHALFMVAGIDMRITAYTPRVAFSSTATDWPLSWRREEHVFIDPLASVLLPLLSVTACYPVIHWREAALTALGARPCPLVHAAPQSGTRHEISARFGAGISVQDDLSSTAARARSSRSSRGLCTSSSIGLLMSASIGSLMISRLRFR